MFHYKKSDIDKSDKLKDITEGIQFNVSFWCMESYKGSINTRF